MYRVKTTTNFFKLRERVVKCETRLQCTLAKRVSNLVSRAFIYDYTDLTTFLTKDGLTVLYIHKQCNSTKRECSHIITTRIWCNVQLQHRIDCGDAQSLTNM